MDADPVPMREFRASLPMALLRAREAVMGEFRPNLAENGLSEQQWRVLRALSSVADAGSGSGPDGLGIGVGELADRTLLLGPSLSRILVKLEEEGLVERTLDENDARRSHITITDDGVDLVRKIAPQSEVIYAGIERRFGRKRLAALVAELHELAEQERAWQAAQNGDEPAPTTRSRSGRR
jgi:homoprotocatechuate degradation regulator HpaR